ncbi:MAG: hypothetical protein U0640_09015 [Phycisphaerales bacterium]
MKPHPRIRKFFKWGGVVVSVVLLTVWVGNAYWWAVTALTPGWSLSVSNGRMMFQVFHQREPAFDRELNWMEVSPRGFDWSVQCGRSIFAWYAYIPLWPFVLVCVGTTAAAWRMDTLAQRRKRLGVCPACGYDRAGLAANAPCPECNAKA